MNFSPILIEKARKYLGEENIRWFAHIKGLKGNINCVLGLNAKKKGLPVHPIHLREGMQIRNWMRGQEECKDFTFEQFEGGWIDLIEKLIEQKRQYDRLSNL